MPTQNEGAHLDPAQSKKLLDGYLRYRFGQTLAADELAKKSGVKPEIIQRLLAHQPVDDGDLTRVANLLGVSAKLLRQICGLEPMSAETLETVRGFLSKAAGPQERAREARG